MLPGTSRTGASAEAVCAMPGWAPGKCAAIATSAPAERRSAPQSYDHPSRTRPRRNDGAPRKGHTQQNQGIFRGREVPYINDKNTAGQDLLNLFFTTFNKYVGKSDKNQAFTPDHICDFMSKAVGVNKNSRVLDPCCGSGVFQIPLLL